MVTVNIDKLSNVIEAYKKYFPSKIEDEIYKWKAVKHFQDNWNIDIDTFGAMLDKSLSKTENLLTSVNSFPHRMIVKFANESSAVVRQMFHDLYDETQDLSSRFSDFMAKAKELKNNWNPEKAHYQNTNSISTYLWLRYPDKYYIYKYSEVIKSAEILEASFKPKKGDISAVINAFSMFDIIAEHVQKDSELRTMLDGVITSDCDKDIALHTMVVDICFFMSRYYKPEVKPETKTTPSSVKYWVCAVGEIPTSGRNATMMALSD